MHFSPTSVISPYHITSLESLFVGPLPQIRRYSQVQRFRPDCEVKVSTNSSLASVVYINSTSPQSSAEWPTPEPEPEPDESDGRATGIGIVDRSSLGWLDQKGLKRSGVAIRLGTIQGNGSRIAVDCQLRGSGEGFLLAGGATRPRLGVSPEGRLRLLFL